MDFTRKHPVVPGIHRALRRGVDSGVFPGGAAAVFLSGKLVHLSSTGDAQVVPSQVRMADLAVFDLASVTKVVATTAAVAVLVGKKLLSLDDAVVRHWPGFGRGSKRQVTLRHLLAHCSGLPAWKPFFLKIAADPGAAPLFQSPPLAGRQLRPACRRGRELMCELVGATPLERPPEEAAVYSDLGFITLGRVIEAASSELLHRFVQREVWERLELPLAFHALDEPRPADEVAVSTGLCRPREPAPGQEKLLPAPDPAAPPDPRPGIVDDDNCFAMGGVAGHAGAFGTARDVAAFGNAILEELAGAGRLAPAPVWTELSRRFGPLGTTRALGFDTPSGTGSSAGRHLARSRAIGHLGFTGTSLWIDVGRQLSVALLTNRTHPRRGNDTIRDFRPAFHDQVVEALGLTGDD